MSSNSDDNVLESILEVLIRNGNNGINQVLERLFNEATSMERDEFLKAKPYERSEERQGYANGYKPKNILLRSGAIKVQIPQVRGLSFYPQSIEKGCRSERALKLAIAEIYVAGVSTRKVRAIAEQLCGTEVSATQVSRFSKIMDEELEKFRSRPLGEVPYVILDARYEKVRTDGVVTDAAVLIAIGVNSKGQREVLGVSISLSEAEVHWRGFLESLVQRGLRGIILITSDDHSGLRNARKAVFPSIPWQRCQFHFAQNAQSYVPKISMREEIAAAVRGIFQCASLSQAREEVKRITSSYEKTASEFTKWLEENIEESLTVSAFPKEHWKHIRTTNLLERVNREVKRRTRVASIFPNKESCLRLVSAILMDIHEDWLGASQPYIQNMDVLRN